MTKLKTLKDLDFWTLYVAERDEERDVVDRDDLKQEAIKWVKDFRERDDEIWESNFMNFFNITEEDLK